MIDKDQTTYDTSAYNLFSVCAEFGQRLKELNRLEEAVVSKISKQ